MKKRKPKPEPLPEPAPQSYSAVWQDGEGESGVYLNNGELTWWYQPGGPNGRFGEVASVQPVEEYLEQGIRISGVPAEVHQDLRRRLGGRE